MLSSVSLLAKLELEPSQAKSSCLQPDLTHLTAPDMNILPIKKYLGVTGYNTFFVMP